MRFSSLFGAALTSLVSGAIVMACVVGERPSAEHILCDGGSCVCAGGYGNCDGDAATGCESVLEIDPKNCGACGTVCVNGTCEAGACACSEGFSDCNEDGTDGCEALLMVDSDHCGSCGRSCLGGPCSDSRCAPFLLAELGTYIYRLTSDADNVFYCDANSGTLNRVAKATGEVVQLVGDQNCYELAVAGGQLFWTVIEHGEELVRVIPTSGGGFRTIAITSRVEGFAAAGDVAVWSEYDSVNASWDIFTSDALGAKTSIAQSIETLRDIVVAQNRVFWIEGSESSETNLIQTAPITGGTPATLVSLDMLIAVEIIVVDDMLYWLQTNPEGEEPTILRVRSSGGVPEELYTRNRLVGDLLGDASGLYWTEDQGDRLLRAPLDGGSIETLAEFQDITLPILGSDALYWIDFPSHLFALAK